ncbi:nidogen-like domain-containing protein [Alteromonas naphthalenivorans]|uniref:Nidogen, extracellular region n=1 Tax=Alteromonas naphthalenivorans TaxID=715451 RepID=F5Z9S6_ALTNA|nr:nidogen-like domain-containing protein [Alteromonas naphthalenivorans]AEF02081.1 nidogen, extracellular region [Alteromonas naphthalenivorans]
MKFKNTLLAASLSFAAFSLQTHADVIISGMGGQADYGSEQTYTEFAPLFNLPFNVNIDGVNFDTFRAFKNGNIDLFSSELSNLEPVLATLSPFVARGNYDCGSCGDTYIGSPSEDVVAVTWVDMSLDAFANGDDETNRQNTFQALIIDRSDDTGQIGDIDIEFRYDELSYRDEGFELNLDGTSLVFGQSEAGVYLPNEEFIALPGSGTVDILELVNNSNVGEDGIWSYSVRNGEVTLAGSQSGSDGTGTELDPFMPSDDVDGSWEFEFSITDDEVIFIDPDVAIGYDYVVESGPEIASVILPSGFDADYELWLMGTSGWEFADNLTAEEEYFFGPDGVTEFRILGIDTTNMIDPDDALAFITGLSFVDTGGVVMTQTPITEFVASPTSVSEPRMFFVLLSAFGLFAIRARKRTK